MRFRVRMKTAFLGGLLLAAAGVAWGEPDRFELSVSGGYLFGGSVFSETGPEISQDVSGKPLPPTRIRSEARFDDAPIYGLRFSYRTAPFLTVEVETARSKNHLVQERFVLSPIASLRSRDVLFRFGFRTDYYMAFALFEPWGGRVRPFVTLGGGAARLDSGFRPETRVTAGAGIGIKGFVRPRYGVRLDARGYATSISRGTVSLGYSCSTSFEGSPGGTVRPVPCPRRRWLINGDVDAALFATF